MDEGERRLVAIMFTDMVGYTALGQESEPLALETLERQRELLRPIFSKHRGREVNAIGDGFLVEFGSALEATLCAIDVQNSVHSLNLERDWKLKVRIGIHVGDVMHHGDDVLGDAVNVASRIEPIAEPGGICISEQVQDHVKNKIPYPLVKLEVRELRDVKGPVDIYRVVMPWDGKEIEPEPPVHLDRRRVAILPMTNISADPNDEYFADGMTEELISTTSSITGLTLVARTSVMGYKGTTKKVEEIGRELSAGTVMEGSVRKAGNRLRVTVQLIDVQSQAHLWAQSYDRELDDIFSVQTDIAKRVAKALRIRILPVEERRIEKKPTEDIEAYALYLKGRYQWNKRTEEGLRAAIEFFQKAVEIDPRYALAYSGLSDSYAILAEWGHVPKTSGFPKAKEFSMKALEFDDGLAEAHASFARALELHDWDWAGSEREFRRAIEINPSYASAHQWYALLLDLLGRFDEAIQEIHRAQELDPLSMAINSSAVPLIYNHAGQYDKAIEQGRKWLKVEQNSDVVHSRLAWSYAGKKMYAEAIQEVETASAMRTDNWVYRVDLGYLYALSGDLKKAEKFFSELLERSKKQYVPPEFVANYYFVLGDDARMFEWLERTYEDHDSSLGFWRFDPEFAKYRQDPRYLDLLRRMNLGDLPPPKKPLL